MRSASIRSSAPRARSNVAVCTCPPTDSRILSWPCGRRASETRRWCSRSHLGRRSRTSSSSSSSSRPGSSDRSSLGPTHWRTRSRRLDTSSRRRTSRVRTAASIAIGPQFTIDRDGKVPPSGRVRIYMNTQALTQVHAAAERASLKDGVHTGVSPRRVHAYFANQLIADSQKVLPVFETKRPPVYWFPIEDVNMDLLARKEASPEATGTVRWRSHTESRTTDNLACRYDKPRGHLAPLQDHTPCYSNAVDAWKEEDDEGFVHPR